MRKVPELNRRGRHNKKVFHLNYEPAMTFDERAEAMRTSRQTVWTLYANALDKIRVALRERAKDFPEFFDHA